MTPISIEPKVFKPKPDEHPWKRSYKTNLTRQMARDNSKVDIYHIKPLAVLLKEIVESWDTMEVHMTDLGYFGKFNLSQMGDKKQAEWLIDLIERNYLQ